MRGIGVLSVNQVALTVATQLFIVTKKDSTSFEQNSPHSPTSRFAGWGVRQGRQMYGVCQSLSLVIASLILNVLLNER